MIKPVKNPSMDVGGAQKAPPLAEKLLEVESILIRDMNPVGFLCSTRWPCIHAQASSTNWTSPVHLRKRKKELRCEVGREIGGYLGGAVGECMIAMIGDTAFGHDVLKG